MYRCAGQKDTGACEAGSRGYVNVGLAAPEPHPPASQVWTVTRYVPVHTSRPCGCAAPRRDDHRVFLGGLRPPKPSRGGAWGNRVSPSPCGAGAWGNPVSPPPSPRAYVHVSHPCGCAAPRWDDHRVFLGGLRPPRPSRGWGHGETRCPHSPAGRGRGETRFPHTPLQEPMFTLDPRACGSRRTPTG